VLPPRPSNHRGYRPICRSGARQSRILFEQAPRDKGLAVEPKITFLRLDDLAIRRKRSRERVLRCACPQGCSDAHFGFGDFGDRDGFGYGTSSGPDVQPGFSGLLAGLRHDGELHRLRLHLPGAVRSISIGPRGPVHHQSIFHGRATAGGTTLSAASPRRRNTPIWKLEAALKCRSCKKGRHAPSRAHDKAHARAGDHTLRLGASGRID
jgi:hypothetical protein